VSSDTIFSDDLRSAELHALHEFLRGGVAVASVQNDACNNELPSK
jgi:hypothetical protein